MLQKKYLNWNEVDSTWLETSSQWEDVSLLIEVNNIVGNSGGYSEYVKGNPWQRLNKDIGDVKTKKLIKIYCKYKNIEYQESKPINESIKVNASEFEIFIKNSISIKVSL